MRLIAFVLFTVIAVAAPAQDLNQAQEIRVRSFVDSYNSRNYKAMRKNFFFVGRIVLSKKTLGSLFENVHSSYGMWNLKSLSYPVRNKATARILVSRDTTEPQYLRFIFNKRNRITGFTFEQPDFVYAKDSAEVPQNADQRHIGTFADSILDLKGKSGNFSGCVLVMEGDEVVYKGCRGYADRGQRNALNDSSVFELASCSKQFTAFAILKLAESGKLKLSDSVFRFIPDFPYKEVTIEHLLNHTSGIPDYMSLFEKHWDKKKIAANKDIVVMLADKKPKLSFRPGERFRYSNTGYAMLSLIIEAASGVSYNDYLHAFIFDPLGMKHSLVNNNSRAAKTPVPNLAVGFVYSDSLARYIEPDSLPDYDYVYYLDGITGDGMVNTTLNDLVAFERALTRGSLLSAESYQNACTSCTLASGKKTRYGYGLSVVQGESRHRLVHHSGSWPGYHTMMVRGIEKPFSVIVLSNNEYLNTQRLADHFVRQVLHVH